MSEPGTASYLASLSLNRARNWKEFQSAMTRTGREDNVILLRKGADAEISSGITRDQASIVLNVLNVEVGGTTYPISGQIAGTVRPLPRPMRPPTRRS